MELQAEYGNQWTKIGRSLERDVPWHNIRHRYMTLKQMEANDALSARPPEYPVFRSWKFGHPLLTAMHSSPTYVESSFEGEDRWMSTVTP